MSRRFTGSCPPEVSAAEEHIQVDTGITLEQYVVQLVLERPQVSSVVFHTPVVIPTRVGLGHVNRSVGLGFPQSLHITKTVGVDRLQNTYINEAMYIKRRLYLQSDRDIIQISLQPKFKPSYVKIESLIK